MTGPGGGAGPSLFDRLRRLSPAARARVIRELPAGASEELAQRWDPDAHDGQRAPGGDWHVWLIRAGRGFGKTRAGAEWISQVARNEPDARIALVGGTIEDARRVMVEGRSGLIAVSRLDEDVIWMPHKGELRFASGARATVFSAATPEALRGPGPVAPGQGLSIGYRPVTVRHGARRELLAVALVEVSLVARPMQPLARVDAVGEPQVFQQGD